MLLSGSSLLLLLLPAPRLRLPVLLWACSVQVPVQGRPVLLPLPLLSVPRILVLPRLLRTGRLAAGLLLSHDRGGCL